MLRFLSKTLGDIVERYFTSVEKRIQSDPQLRRLHNAVQIVGREFEQRPYNELLATEEMSIEREFDGVICYFSAEAFRVDPNGDIHFAVHANGPPKRIWQWKPSYQFIKRKDGSIEYL